MWMPWHQSMTASVSSAGRACLQSITPALTAAGAPMTGITTAGAVTRTDMTGDQAHTAPSAAVQKLLGTPAAAKHR